MSGQTFKTWEELWTFARQAGFTHWNYSRGKSRFRAALSEPEAIGDEPLLLDEDLIRIRLFRIVGEEYVPSDTDYSLKVPPGSGELPEDFDDWESDRQKGYLDIQLQRISAARFSKQMASADRLLYRFIDQLALENAKKDSLIKELNTKIHDLLASKGIGNVWEFLTHPNAERVIDSLTRAMAHSKERVNVIEELKNLANSPDGRKLLEGSRKV